MKYLVNFYFDNNCKTNNYMLCVTANSYQFFKTHHVNSTYRMLRI